MVLIRYLLVGVANTFVGLSTIYFAMYFLQLDIVYANAFGYSIGILLSFVLNKAWTFNSGDRIVSSFIRYLLVLAVGLRSEPRYSSIYKLQFRLKSLPSPSAGDYPLHRYWLSGQPLFRFPYTRKHRGDNK